MKIGTGIIIAIAALGAISAFAVFGTNDDHTAEIESIKNNIYLYDAKKMYPEAVQQYNELISIDDENYDLVIEYKDYCKLHGFQSEYISACEKAMSLKSDDFGVAKEYLEWLNSSGNEGIYSYLHNKIDTFENDERAYFENYYDEIKGNYKILSSKFTNISEWHNNSILYPGKDGYYILGGNEYYAFVKHRDGYSAIINKDGNTIFEAGEIVSYSPDQNLISAHHEEQMVYLNSNGQRSIVPFENNELVYYDYLGTFSSGFAPFNIGDKWGYINTAANVVLSDYEYTTPFSNGIAAVKENGKWAILKISSDGFSMITDYIYDDILLDEYGYAFTNGYAYVKKSGSQKWSLVRVKLNEEYNSVIGIDDIGSLTFDNAKPFGMLGAVEVDGKWGFISLEGEWVIEPEFDDAGSLDSGLAPVKVSDKWGYIDATGKMILEPQFDEAGSFNDKGIATVTYEGQCRLIQLLEYVYR